MLIHDYGCSRVLRRIADTIRMSHLVFRRPGFNRCSEARSKDFFMPTIRKGAIKATTLANACHSTSPQAENRDTSKDWSDAGKCRLPIEKTAFFCA